SIGVATVGGEIYFEGPYENNCLVNAMCLGIAPAERLIRSAAAGEGNSVVLLGARTGRDGIGGASVLASAELGEDEDKRPSVQIGDPFEEKKLLECCLELLDAGQLRSLQDLGAAGLSSSVSEMASKGGVGIDLDVARVPRREDGMEPFEVMISESQERMLCVVEPDRLEAVLDTCARWDVRATRIGEVTSTGSLRVFDGEELVGDMPVAALVDDCPLYELEPQRPAEPVYPQPPAQIADDLAPEQALLALLASPNIASKRLAFEQYDCLVGSRTAARPGEADAAVLTLAPDGGEGAIAVSIDGNGRRVACDPYVGAAEAVLECAANLACTGAEPLGLTNCLNFGNPEKPHVAWQLERAVAGLRDACLALGVPVVGGNVSLYNESGDGPIYPTPVVGMVGRLTDPERAAPSAFAAEGHEVALVGPFAPSLAGSEIEKLRGRLAEGAETEPLEFELHVRALTLVREAVAAGKVASAHDVSDGGIACALAESALGGGIGARVDLGELAEGALPEVALFGEGPGGVVVSGPPEGLAELEATAGAVGFTRLGETAGDTLELVAGGASLSVSVEDARTAYESAIPDRLR
ncbi:MAG: phosphoribosylformylglycinamidine synthase subunit PurL, partial [Thermoleophilaceae bacterium]